MSDKRAFFDALKDIMQEHKVTLIDLNTDPCSDWHGIYGEEMTINFEDHPPVILCEGNGFNWEDIQTYLDRL